MNLISDPVAINRCVVGVEVRPAPVLRVVERFGVVVQCHRHRGRGVGVEDVLYSKGFQAV
jgi:hypothetical protein